MRCRNISNIVAICTAICAFALSYDYWATRVNPYSKDTWITPVFTTQIDSDGSISISKVRDIQVKHTSFAPIILYANIVHESILRFFTYDTDGPIAGDESEIIAALHAERFDPSRAYIITGGHFPDLYVRNLGIFYSSLLDPRVPTNEDDWINRQRITLQTLATHLELLRVAGKEYTTFAPVDSQTFAPINWNDEPSDSLFALTYTIRAASDDSFIPNRFPAPLIERNTVIRNLTTQKAANELLREYRPTIEKELARYLALVIDPATGLANKKVALSGARDNVRRESGFYDNIIAYATAKDAAALGLKLPCPAMYQLSKSSCDFEQWKKNITRAFWREQNGKGGLFIEDLSTKSLEENTFTGEEFLALQIGFLDVHDKADRETIFKMVEYVKDHGLDLPFPLLYAAIDDRGKASNFLVGLTSYAGHSIWSHLGQAYLQSLILISPEHPELLLDIEAQLRHYKKNIEKYGGYPELYNADGTFFTAPVSRAVLRVGWVINYEQTKMLYHAHRHRAAMDKTNRRLR